MFTENYPHAGVIYLKTLTLKTLTRTFGGRNHYLHLACKKAGEGPVAQVLSLCLAGVLEGHRCRRWCHLAPGCLPGMQSQWEMVAVLTDAWFCQ